MMLNKVYKSNNPPMKTIVIIVNAHFISVLTFPGSTLGYLTANYLLSTPEQAISGGRLLSSFAK